MTQPPLNSQATPTYHLRISGGALSVVVIAEQRYGPCWLSDDNNNNNNNLVIYLIYTLIFKQRLLTYDA